MLLTYAWRRGEFGPGRDHREGQRRVVVLGEAYARLGFDAVGDEAFKQLVLARVVEPTSKADSLRVLDPQRHPRPLTTAH
ncbi:MAG: hypothetical protein U0Q10_13250 [Dermatophilaceae bacterium]